MISSARTDVFCCDWLRKAAVGGVPRSVLVEHERRRHRDDEVENERVQIVELRLLGRVRVVDDGGTCCREELGGTSLQVPDDPVTPVGVLGSGREDELLDRALGRPVRDEALVSDVATGVVVGPPVVELVVETNVTVHLKGPEAVVVLPPVADLSSRKGRTEPLEAAVVAGVGVVQAAGEWLTAVHTSGLVFEHIRHEAAEVRRTVPTTLHLGQLTIEVVVLRLGVGAGQESSRVAVGLPDDNAGLAAVHELLAAPGISPALAGVGGEVEHGLLEGIELHRGYSFVLVQIGRKLLSAIKVRAVSYVSR